MKWANEIIIPAAMGLVVIAILVIMRGVLNFVIGLPLWLIGIVLAVAGTTIFILFNMIIGFYRHGKEGFTFMEARKTGKLVICDVEIGTNNAEFVLGEKKDPKSPLFEDDKSGVKLDPTMVSDHSEPMSFPGGLKIIGYGYKDFLPQTTRNHLAFKAIVDYFAAGERGDDKDHPAKKLSFLTPKEKIILISKPEHFLEADLKMFVGKYFKTRYDGNGDAAKTVYFRIWPKVDPMTGQQVYKADGTEVWYEQQVEIPELIRAVQQMKSDIGKLPIYTGYFCMNEAFKNNNVAYTAQHVADLKNLLYQLATEAAKAWDRIWTYGCIIIGIIGVTGLAFFAIGKYG